MNKIRTISTRIDSFIKNADLTYSPTLQQIYNDYAEGINYLNERLAICEGLLQKGKYGEAVVLADKTPSLFELVPLIQAPNIVEFFDICQMYGLQTPPLLNVSVFQSLEKALNSSETKEGLFAELRKLSRTQGSEEKVIILRKIAKLEPENPEWTRQLRQAESTCVPALVQKAQQAIVDLDYATLSDLEESLSSHEWELVVPEVVLNKIHRVLAEEQQRQLRHQAKEIIANVDLAYANQNVTDYTRAQGHWKMLCDIDHYVPTEDENHHFSIANAFFAEKQKTAAETEEYNDILREFSGLIQSSYDVEYDYVQTLYKRLASFNKEIPANITAFVNERKESNERAEQKNKVKQGVRRVVLCFASIIILVIGCVAVWYSYNRKNFQKELAVAMQKKNVVRAGEIVSAIKKSPLPYLLFSSKLRELTSNYEVQEKEYASFLQAADKLEQILKGVPSESQRAQIETLLNECKAKATNDSSRSRLAVLVKLYETNFVAKIQEKQQNVIKTHLGRIRQLFNKFSGEIASAKYKDADSTYKDFLTELRELKSIAFFDAATLSAEDKKIVSPFAWLLAKHKRIHAVIDAGINNNVYAPLKSMLDQYSENENQLLTEGTMAQIKEAKLPSAADLSKRVTLAKNNFTVLKQIKDLESLAKELEKLLTAEKVQEAEKVLAKYKKMYADAAKITPISQDNQKSIKKLDRAEEFSKKIAGIKSLSTVSVCFQNKVGSLYDFNARSAMLSSIDSAESALGLTSQQKDLLSALRKQVEHLRKIHDFQKNISSAIWDNQSYPYFTDVAFCRLLDQKDKEFFSGMKDSLDGYVSKYKSKEKVLIAFRDGKGNVKYYEILKSRFLNSLSEKASPGGGTAISFKADSSTVTIEGNQVTVSKEVDGADTFTVYKNVTFLYPSKITTDSLKSAVCPYQKLFFDVNQKIAAMPDSFFSPEYYDLLVDLKKTQTYSPAHLLELYSVLLAPFDQMKDFTYSSSGRNYSPFNNPATRDALQDISALSQRVKQLLQSARRESTDSLYDFRDRYNARIGQLNFDPVQKFVRISSSIKSFYAETLKREYLPVGILTLNDKNIHFEKGDNVVLRTGELWIFDPNGKIILAGLCDQGKITWNEINLSSLHMSIVFMPNDKIDTVRKSLDYRNTLTGYGAESIAWPAFLPQNVQR